MTWKITQEAFSITCFVLPEEWRGTRKVPIGYHLAKRRWWLSPRTMVLGHWWSSTRQRGDESKKRSSEAIKDHLRCLFSAWLFSRCKAMIGWSTTWPHSACLKTTYFFLRGKPLWTPPNTPTSEGCICCASYTTLEGRDEALVHENEDTEEAVRDLCFHPWCRVSGTNRRAAVAGHATSHSFCTNCSFKAVVP